jgi:phosphatidate cytidylyltransferase
MLKYRLFFGILMAVSFAGLMLLDGWLDGALTVSRTDDRAIQGTILCLLVAFLQIPSHRELAGLAKAKGVLFSVPVTVIGSILLVLATYMGQWLPNGPDLSGVVLVICFLGLFFFHALKYGNEGVLSRCSGGCLALIYFGWFSQYVIAIRIEFGLWPLLMYIFVVKASDIGAYVIGRLIGAHPFAPRISPAKTWEGMAGAVVFAVIFALVFADGFGIMSTFAAMIFGGCFAFIGQMGDLVESMMKRDAVLKDSSDRVPGFGGLLDVFDSLLVAAPFAYLFYTLCCHAAV